MHYLIHYRCAKCLDYSQTCNSDLLCNFQWNPPMMRIFYCDSNQIRQRYYVIYIKIKVTGNNSTYWSARRKPVMLIWFRANLWPCSRHFLYYYFLHLLSTYFHSTPGAQALSLEHIRTTISSPIRSRHFSWLKGLSSSGRSHSTKGCLAVAQRDANMCASKGAAERNFTPWELIGSGCKYLKTPAERIYPRWLRDPFASREIAFYEIFPCAAKSKQLLLISRVQRSLIEISAALILVPLWIFSPSRRGNLTN
jgi:hypothetical protein